jgi:hypothetical protein
MSVSIKIIGCPKWRARPPKQGITVVGMSKRIIFHHTAGHGINFPPPKDREEAIAYARAVQNYHMDSNGWIDSGHNFLVMRSGVIIQGRWLTISAILAHHMVHSAHCPGQNDQIGIEHEHKGTEEMTAKQRESSARLQAWIADKYGLEGVLPVDPHSAHFNTSCPANLIDDIVAIRQRAKTILHNES